MAVIDLLDNTAANDVVIQHANAAENGLSAHDIETIEKLISNRLSNSVLSARSEIAAGLDGVSHQLLQTQQEQLTLVERSLKRQIKPIHSQLIDLQDNNALFNRIQPLMQKHMLLIAEKISRNKVDALSKEHLLKIQALENQQQQLTALINSKSQQAMTKGIIGGAILGASIALITLFASQ